MTILLSLNEKFKVSPSINFDIFTILDGICKYQIFSVGKNIALNSDFLTPTQFLFWQMNLENLVRYSTKYACSILCLLIWIQQKLVKISPF